MKVDNLDKILDLAEELHREIEIVSDIRSGKEAAVYRVLLDGQLVAMKVYINPEERMFSNAGQYLTGKYYAQSSQRKAMAKGNSFSKKLKQDNWIKREFYLLEKLYELGAKIPKPIWQLENAIFMELLGDEQDVALRLCNVDLTKEEAEKFLEIIIDTAVIFWKFGIVHADLSEYNILLWKNEPYIIDFPQAIDKRTHPEVDKILARDLHNVVRFFSKFMEVDYETVRRRFAD
jgi:RIO kinase 1